MAERSYETIRAETDVRGIATLTLAHPPLNVLDIPMLEEMGDALDRMVETDGVRVVVIRAEGRAFSAGVDVKDHVEEKVPVMISVFHHVVRTLDASPVPSVAVVQGSALGGGMELVLACDFAIAAEGATFAQPEVKLAVFPPVALLKLPRSIPERKALEICMLGEPMTAADAERWGIVNRTVPASELDAAAGAMVEKILALSPAVLSQMLDAHRHARELPYGAAFAEIERRYLEDLMRTEDANEGIRSFMEKRPPKWKGR